MAVMRQPVNGWISLKQRQAFLHATVQTPYLFRVRIRIASIFPDRKSTEQLSYLADQRVFHYGCGASIPCLFSGGYKFVVGAPLAADMSCNLWKKLDGISQSETVVSFFRET